MESDNESKRLIPDSIEKPVEQRMHPVIARFRSGLRERDQQELDQLYVDSEANIEIALETVGFVTDLEKILFVMLLQLQKNIYLQDEKNKQGMF